MGFYALAYAREHAGPSWAAYHLSRSKMLAVEALGLPRDDYFREDPGVETGGCDSPNHGDYTGVGARGLARGHLAPSKAMSWDPDAQDATYVTANVVPQHGGFNSGAWAKLEGNVRAWACTLGTVYVVTGVIHGPGAEPPLPWDDGTDIDVPTQVYKVTYTPAQGGRAVAFLFDNAGMPATAAALRAGMLSVDRLEAAAGLDVMPDLSGSQAKRLESAPADPRAWPLAAGSTFACTRDSLAARPE
ncbi:DNA/RNA non-specific endonuclease [Rhodovibrio sodomensis]|uniref:DNA/RNA non-specific endonuclease n=1 Tax=Rhodovibrio sodomensis TaxID=1088 RepID=UPI0019064C0A